MGAGASIDPASKAKSLEQAKSLLLQDASSLKDARNQISNFRRLLHAWRDSTLDSGVQTLEIKVNSQFKGKALASVPADKPLKVEDRPQTEDLFKRRLTVYYRGEAGKGIWKKYKPGRKLGAGLCGEVMGVTDIITGREYACKSVPKKHIKGEKLIQDLRKEIQLLQTLDHPNIIKMYEAWETDKHIYIILELATGGDLFENLMEASSYSEATAAHIFRQMLRAIQYCHETGISHRDIKLENFLFCKPDDKGKPSLKLIDFGLSKRFVGSGITRMRSTVGTTYYVAPEVLKRKPYTSQCDMWSLGVVLFMLLTGKSPWPGVSEPEILMDVSQGRYCFMEDDWKSITSDAKDLVVRLLNMNYDERLTAVQALQHPWMRDTSALQTEPLSSKLDGMKVLKALKEFSGFGELKKVVIDVIAFSLDPQLMKESRESFRFIDKDGNGTISVTELVESLKTKGVTDTQISDVFNSIDQDRNGTISFSEFLAATLDKSKYLSDDRLMSAFQRLDTDHDGHISISDLKEALGDWYTPKEIEDMLKDIRCKFVCAMKASNASAEAIAKFSDDAVMVDFSTFLEIMYDGEHHHKIKQESPKAASS